MAYNVDSVRVKQTTRAVYETATSQNAAKTRTTMSATSRCTSPATTLPSSSPPATPSTVPTTRPKARRSVAVRELALTKTT